ncbi:MAG: BON domain-containing protein [Proteobacteria bacterium]|nr:MAG: BON domain-containing protein [Pseudomonadota bacterium]
MKSYQLVSRHVGGTAIVVLSLTTLLVGCQKTSTTAETPSGTSTTTTYSVPAAPALSASASSAANSAMSSASQALGQAEEKIDDGALTAKVKAALLTAADVKALQINVDSKDGIVSLNGTQETSTAIERAVAVARGTAGVISVENKLTIKIL